jgi:tRNA(fMet)-specific endonuclease VapC
MTPRRYATLRSELVRQGSPVGPNDTLIPVHALSHGLAVVTANAGEFSRVPGPIAENWLEH